MAPTPPAPEWARLSRVLDAAPPRWHAYVLTVYLTGCRPGEALAMTWTALDLEAGTWLKPRTKSGQPQAVGLPAQLVARLRGLPRDRPPFPWHSANARKVWGLLRHRAGLVDLRLHDLRRSCASELVAEGVPLPVIQDVLAQRSERGGARGGGGSGAT